MKGRSQRGFTLLEVLVASVLLGTVFVAVVSLMSQSLRNVQRMEPHDRAMLHAREIMNQELLLDELEPSRSSGQWSDGYRWQVEIEAEQARMSQPQPAPQRGLVSVQQPASESAAARPGQPTLFRIRAAIAWGDAGKPHTYDVETTQWAVWKRPRQP